MTHVLLNGESSVPKIPRTDVDSPSGNVVTSRRGGGSSVRRRFHKSSSTRARIDPARATTREHRLGRKNREISREKEAALLDDTLRLDSQMRLARIAAIRNGTLGDILRRIGELNQNGAITSLMRWCKLNFALSHQLVISIEFYSKSLLSEHNGEISYWSVRSILDVFYTKKEE